MRDILNRLFEHGVLDRKTARKVLLNIAKEQYNPSQISAFLTVYLMRAITVEELAGFRDALLELCVQVSLSGHLMVDVCGTGGDGKDTFNISTITAFIVAGAGYKVAKHGNYSVSSSCGSSNVLEYFGHQFTNDSDKLNKQLDAAGICFLHAPMFHPAMKTVAPIRRDLGIKTFFNMLGPLVNPVQPHHQLVGVFSLELARMYHYLLQHEGIQYAVIHDLNGYDEVSLTGRVKVYTNSSETILDPLQLSERTFNPSDLFGGNTVKEASEIFLSILENRGTPAQTAVALANAAMAIQRFDPEKSYASARMEAGEALESGAALKSFKSFINS